VFPASIPTIKKKPCKSNNFFSKDRGSIMNKDFFSVRKDALTSISVSICQKKNVKAFYNFLFGGYPQLEYLPTKKIQNQMNIPQDMGTQKIVRIFIT
jgi:hypothetical protein